MTDEQQLLDLSPFLAVFHYITRNFSFSGPANVHKHDVETFLRAVLWTRNDYKLSAPDLSVNTKKPKVKSEAVNIGSVRQKDDKTKFAGALAQMVRCPGPIQTHITREDGKQKLSTDDIEIHRAPEEYVPELARGSAKLDLTAGKDHMSKLLEEVQYSAKHFLICRVFDRMSIQQRQHSLRLVMEAREPMALQEVIDAKKHHHWFGYDHVQQSMLFIPAYMDGFKRFQHAELDAAGAPQALYHLDTASEAATLPQAYLDLSSETKRAVNAFVAQNGERKFQVASFEPRHESRALQPQPLITTIASPPLPAITTHASPPQDENNSPRAMHDQYRQRQHDEPNIFYNHIPYLSAPSQTPAGEHTQAQTQPSIASGYLPSVRHMDLPPFYIPSTTPAWSAYAPAPSTYMRHPALPPTEMTRTTQPTVPMRHDRRHVAHGSEPYPTPAYYYNGAGGCR